MAAQHEREIRRVEAIYDRAAPDWDRREGFAERVFLGSAYRLALANELRGDVLEIGVGTGATLRYLARRPKIATFTGIDLSTGMLTQAHRAAANLPFPVDLRQMDATHLDFPTASFDTVTASLTLCTVPDPERTLREMARVCRPDGQIVLLEHVLSPNPVVAWGLRRLAPIQSRLLGCHLDRTTDHLVRDLGFRVEREESRLFGIFHLIVARPPSPR